MIVDGSSRDFTAVEDPEDGICRLRKELMDSGARGIKHENGGGQLKSKSFRRKRLELRRMSSLAAEKSAAGGGCVSSDHDGGRSRKRRSILELGNNSTGCGRIDGSCHGTASHIGRRREMEDMVTAELSFLRRCGRDYDFYGVYDGHGGRRVADSCAEMMHVMLARALEDDDGVAWHMAMAAAFRDMDAEVNRYGTEVATMGSTAVVAVVGEEELVVANCGDSRAVLSRGGAAVQLLEDHKPDRDDELERIEACGGKVINWNGARVIGVLATSRSIGDSYLKPYVIPDPEVRVISRTISDEFLILASDGLWDVVTNELACQVVRRCLAGRLRRATLFCSNDRDADGKSEEKVCGSRFEEAAATLAELAIGKGSGDNVSVVVVGLS